MNSLAKFLKLIVVALPLGLVISFSGFGADTWQFWALVIAAGVYGAAIGLIMGGGQ